MSFTFSLNVTDDQLESAKKSIIDNGGDINSKYFDVKGVEGSYNRSGNSMQITITDSPWLASDSMIESEIRKFFN